VAPCEKAIWLGREAYGPIEEADTQIFKQFSEAEK